MNLKSSTSKFEPPKHVIDEEIVGKLVYQDLSHKTFFKQGQENLGGRNHFQTYLPSDDDDGDSGSIRSDEELRLKHDKSTKHMDIGRNRQVRYASRNKPIHS
jgi:hypothetical protein